MVIGLARIGTVNGDKGVFIARAVVGGLIGAGLWLWMALASRVCQNFARIVCSCFFGIGVLSNLGNLLSG